MQSSTGFDPSTFGPIAAPVAPPVSQLSGSFMGTRTFYAGGTGRLVGTTQLIIFTGNPPGITPVVSATVTTQDSNFTWTAQGDGTLLILDDNSMLKQFTAPPARLGFTATTLNTPSFVAQISKDKRTIVMTHAGMAVETTEVRNASNVLAGTAPRLCTRSHVATRLP